MIAPVKATWNTIENWARENGLQEWLIDYLRDRFAIRRNTVAEIEIDKMFFRQPGELWRLSLPPASPALPLQGKTLLDWGGAQRWYLTETPAIEVRDLAARNGGHATLFRGASDADRFHPLPPALLALQRRIRLAFDPHGLFNPGRLGRNG